MCVESGGSGSEDVVEEIGGVEGSIAMRGVGPTNCDRNQSLLTFMVEGGGAAGSTYPQSLPILPPPARAHFLDQAASTVPAAEGGISPPAFR